MLKRAVPPSNFFPDRVENIRVRALSLGSLLTLLFLASLASAQAQTITITSSPYNASTGSADNAAAIQAAIQAVGSGGTVVVPAGKFLSGPVTLKSNMTFQLSAGATLQMTAMGTFPENTDFVYGSKLTNVTIDGSGLMDGQGQAWWTAFNNGGSDNRPPAMIELTGCAGVTVSGISVINSPKFHVQFMGNGNNVLAEGLTITAPWPSPNTDGIDLRGTNVNIQNCYISDGDDVVQIGGSNACSGITVTGCTFGTGHGLSIGSITDGGVNNVLVNNCVFDGTQYGLRLKADDTNGGTVSNVTYSNIVMTNIMKNPILMYSYYPDVPASPTTDTGSSVNSTTPYWKNINFENVTASEAATGKSNVGILWGLPQAPVSNVLFDACTLTGPEIMEVFNARGVTFDCNCLVNGKAPSNSSAVTTYNAAMAGADDVAFPACGSTPSATPTKTPVPLPTATHTMTPNPPTPSPTHTALPTATATRTPTPAPTSTATVTATRTATVTFTRTATPTSTATATASSTRTPSPTSTASWTATPTRTPSSTPTWTLSPTATDSPTETVTSIWTATPSFTQTPTRTSTVAATATRSFTETPTTTATFTQTPTPSFAPTFSPTPTATVSDTATVTHTVTPIPPTPLPTQTESSTATPTPTLVWTPTPTETSAPLAGGPPLTQPIPYPNPARDGAVRIHFVLAKAPGDVKIRIFTTAFRKVRVMDLGALPAGIAEPFLNLVDDQGVPLANGIYYVEVSDPQARSVGKLMVLR